MKPFRIAISMSSRCGTSLEHLADLVATLTEVARVIKPGGLLAVSTGNVEGPLARHDLDGWGLMGPPWHLFYFSPKTIEQLLNATGFEVNRIYLMAVSRPRGARASRGPVGRCRARYRRHHVRVCASR